MGAVRADGKDGVGQVPPSYACAAVHIVHAIAVQCHLCGAFLLRCRRWTDT